VGGGGEKSPTFLRGRGYNILGRNWVWGGGGNTTRKSLSATTREGHVWVVFRLYPHRLPTPIYRERNKRKQARRGDIQKNIWSN